MKKKLVITGSEGLIGKKLVEHFKNTYEVLSLDKALGHDLTDETFVKKWFGEHKDLYGMIVCHAYNPVPTKDSKRIEPTDVPLSEVRDYMEVNAVSAFSVCRQFIKNNTSGSIINVSSLYGVVSPKHHIYTDFVKNIGYSMSKATVIIMSKYLATYYAPDIRVNAVIFGGVEDPNQDTDFVKKYNAETPMKRMMHLDETISVFEFLLDERSSYVTGTEVYVDGGWTAW
ncbi:hypothetical protein A2763_02005 [Candidatus Kaiserbacteria bacterium RIFCSPHIGHO2_01_FULL_54_36]|uniref:Dehydrogenase n=1 Tax=Candidatus Kaiserbacteria bacterium RIFCSPHIGHO2_01_FULL_54_36 TaxID=1798482 RepID=A0A1F6CPK7_9BACT|nr:MAG: hypothetical protein A2763_02005 [Candidatus Kaiserbacteria bacterium RIFCSPHIGHO2_01_FULL_54_36]OGG75883.1 MAG: hypothetical protein A3A41_04475 [Candidatus Kaiserbacteria bacterium RIFCSPLOWO2_01_FULL_54_22]